MAANRFTVLTLSLVALLAVLPACAGKDKKSNHAKAVAAHKERYNEIRSGLILNMAQQQFDSGDLDQAEESLREAIQMDTRNPRLHTLSGRIAVERGQLERAFRLFELSVDLDLEAQRAKITKKTEDHAIKPRYPEPLYYQGVVLQRWQQFEQAEDAYRQAYEIQPDNPSYLMAQAEMLVELNRVDEAVELLESRRTYFDQNASLRAAIGHLYRMKGEPAAAVPYFTQAALLAPDNNRITEELALTQLAAHQNDAAMASLEKLVAKAGDGRADLQRALATAYARTGRGDQARQLFLTIARGPQGAAADWVKVGELALQDGDPGTALNAANRATALQPDAHEGYLLAGMALQKRGAFEESLRMFDRAASLAPTNAAPLILRGISLERAGRKTAAAEAYREALRRQPADARAQKLLANVQ